MIGKEFLVYLIKIGKISQHDLQQCVQESKTQQIALPKILISQGHFTAQSLKELLNQFYQLQQQEKEILSPEQFGTPLAPISEEQTVLIPPPDEKTPLSPLLEAETVLISVNETPSVSKFDAKTVIEEQKQIATQNIGNAKRIIGKYEVLEELAKGGMGVVYKVRHQELNQIYALKLLLSGSLASEEDIKRFYREAQTTAKLKHPNIVQIIDVGKVENQHYICMELIEGKTLEDKFQEEKKVAIRSYLLSFKKILNALHYAHNQGIIHRDLKPANIFLTKTEEPKLVDFGLAKDVSQQNQKLTQSGTILGTPLYMAPEQAQGEVRLIGKSSDVYSIGACLYQALTKRCPFEGATIHELFYKITSEEAKIPSSLNPKIHGDLDTIILKSLHKEPLKRYRTAKAFEEDLERFLAGYPILAKPGSRVEKAIKWGKRNKALVAFSLLFLFSCTFLLSYFLWGKTQQEKDRIASYLEQAKLQREKANKLSSSDRKQRNEKINALMTANHTLNLALSSKNEALKIQLETEKFNLGEELITLACKNESYQFALYIFSEMEQLENISEEKKIDLERKIQKYKDQLLKVHLSRFDYWITQFQNPEIKLEESLVESALLEISKMQEEEIFRRLLGFLAEGVHYFLNDKKQNPHKNIYYEILVKALGWLENPKAGIPLIDALEQFCQKISKSEKEQQSVVMQHYMVAIAQALVDSKAISQAEKFTLLRAAMPQNGIFFVSTEFVAKQLGSLKEPDKEIIKTLPLTAKDNYLRGNQYFARKEYQKALTDYNEAIRLQPDNYEFYDQRGKTKLELKQFRSAIQDYDQAITLKKDISEIYINRGEAKKNLKDFDGALKDYQKALEKNSKALKAYLGLGEVYLHLEKFELTKENLEKAFQISPNHPEAHFFMGLMKHKMGIYTQAIESYDRAILFQPQFVKAYGERGAANFMLGFKKEALTDYNKALALDPKNTSIYISRGMLNIDQKNYQRALQDFNKVLQIEPNNFFAYCARGGVKTQLKEYRGALEDYDKALQLERNYDKAYFGRGILKYTVKNYEGAIQDLNKTLQLNPKTIDAYFTRAKSYRALGNYQKALLDCNSFLKSGGHLIKGLLELGLINESLKNFQAAIGNYNQVLALEPKNIKGYFNRGNVKRILKDYQGALKDYSYTIKLQPQLSDPYFGRAFVKMKLKDPKGALADCDTFLRLAPSRNVKELEPRIQTYNLMIQIDPTNGVLYYGRALTRYQLNDFVGALNDIEKAIQLNYRISQVYCDRGAFKQRLKYDAVDILNDYKKAIELDPKLVKAYFNRGYFYLNIVKNKEKAKKDFQSYLKLTKQETHAKERNQILHLFPELKK